MKKILFITVLLLTPFFVISQTNYTVKGKIADVDGYAPAGNIIALHPKDSTLLKGTFFLDGEFELTDLQEKEILLQFTSLEFEDIFRKIEFGDSPILDLGELRAQKAGVALSEVVVKSRRPIYTQKADGTVSVLIENTTLAASNSVNEILSRSPDVIVNEEGGISLFGKGNAIFYLNGTRILTSQLALILPSNIKKIEIIRNPSAKYDADGAAVISITTIKNRGEGYQANVQQNVTHSEFADGMDTHSSINLNMNKGRFSANAFYSVFQGKDRELLFTTRDRKEEAIFLNSSLTTDWQREYKHSSNFGLGLQYDIDKESYLSIAYSGYSEMLGGNTFSDNEIIDNETTSFYESQVMRAEKDGNNSISFNYNRSLDTLGTSLFIGGQYANFFRQNDNFILEKGTEEAEVNSRFLRNMFDLDLQLFSGQLDFNKVFNNKNSLTFGTKYSQVDNGSIVDFSVAEDGVNFSIINDLSNNFNYQEAIGAAYLSFNGQWKNDVNYTIGLRGELTDYDLRLSQINNQKIANTYLNVFPNLTMNKRFSENHTLNFSYTSNISRPAYQNLNPVLIYQDPYTSIQGNPNLEPQKTHAFELSSQLKTMTFKIGYNYAIDPFSGAAVRGETDKSYILKSINHDFKKQLFASVSKSFSTDWWTSRNTFNLKYTKYINNTFDFEEYPSKPHAYFYSNNRFTIGDLFHAEAIFWYRGAEYDGLRRGVDRHNLTLTLEKSFLDNALKVRLIANDIFHGNVAAGYYNVGETAIYYNRRWDTDYYRISVSYNFGRLKNATYKNKSIGKSESNRAG